jgi:hypothetical protein
MFDSILYITVRQLKRRRSLIGLILNFHKGRSLKRARATLLNIPQMILEQTGATIHTRFG